jgi:5-methylcytosine-specific restriction endonuclease McrA
MIWPKEVIRLERKLVGSSDIRGLMDAVLRSEIMARHTPSAERAYEYIMWCKPNIVDRSSALPLQKERRGYRMYTCGLLGNSVVHPTIGYDWVNDIVLMQRFLQETPDLPDKKRRRVNLPSAVRFAVWNTHIGKKCGAGPCYCCGGEIAQQEFECGHILAVANGGTNEISNLRVLCRTCNRSMGDQHMDEFIAKHFKGV